MTSPADTDLLQRAARALRDEADAAHACDAIDPRDTVESWQTMDAWREVSREVRRNGRRRRLGMIVALQLLVGLAGVGAWAAASGRLPPLLSRLISSARRADPAPAARAHAARARRETPAPPAPAPPLAIEAPPWVPPPPPRVAAPPARPAPRPPAPAGPEPDELYARAHHAQFALHDYVAALALWDAYLANGGGSLALEARWNRAIALIRLGQREAAITALAPFAAGENDGYRQEEAQALLRVWGAAPP